LRTPFSEQVAQLMILRPWLVQRQMPRLFLGVRSKGSGAKGGFSLSVAGASRGRQLGATVLGCEKQTDSVAPGVVGGRQESPTECFC